MAVVPHRSSGEKLATDSSSSTINRNILSSIKKCYYTIISSVLEPCGEQCVTQAAVPQRAPAILPFPLGEAWACTINGSDFHLFLFSWQKP